MTTDACLLGAIAQEDNPIRLLDIGTGTGVIALMLAQRYPQACIDAIEIDPVISHQAQKNIRHSEFSDRIHVHTMDVLKFTPDYPYDLIVCNPPYFSKHLEGAPSARNSAIHNKTLEHGMLLDFVRENLKVNGTFYLILPETQMDMIQAMATQKGLFASEMIHVFNKPDKSYRKIVAFKRNPGTSTRVRKLLLHESDGSRTHEFKALMFDFYLDDNSDFKSKKSNN